MNEITIYSAMTNEDKKPYVSFSPNTSEAASTLLKAMNNPDEMVSNYINLSIEVANVYIKREEVVDKETGEVTEQPKIVLFDTTGKSYVTISKGIYQALSNTCTLIGTPDKWVSPITIKIIQVPTKKGSMLSFEVIDWGTNF